MKKLLAWCAIIIAAIQAPGQSGVPPKLQFDVVSIKLDRSGAQHGYLQISPDGDRIIVVNAPMYRIVSFAFNFQRNDLVLGAPEWAHNERYDMEAKVAPADLPAFHALNFVQQKAMLQKVLIERCKMHALIQKKEIPVYALIVNKDGMKMHEIKPGDSLPVVRDASGKVVDEWDLIQKHGEVHGRAVPMDAFMYALSNISVGRQVIDRTDLKGLYDFDLVWTPEEDGDGQTKGAADDTGTSDASRTSIFTAIQEQMGLRLAPEKAPVDALVVEHIERPSND